MSTDPNLKSTLPATKENKTNDVNVNVPIIKKKIKKRKVKPSTPRDIKLSLIDPNTFLIEFNTPKKLGKPLPLYYDIVINDHLFKKAVIQKQLHPHSNTSNDDNNNKTKPYKHRILVENCDSNTIYKVGISVYNDSIKGPSTPYYRIKTINKPSIIKLLNMKNGIITFKPPTYTSYGNLLYELIDVTDKDNHISISSTKYFIINVDEMYKFNGLFHNIKDRKWKIRIKEPICGYYSETLVFTYNAGDIATPPFTDVKFILDDKSTLKKNVIKLQYPQWKPPPKPDLLKDVSAVKLINKDTYLLVPTQLDLNKNGNVLSCMTFSDTHTKHDIWRFDELPSADIIIHSGDFTFDGRKSEVEKFEKWGKFLSSLHIDEAKNKEIYNNYYNNNIIDDIKIDIADRKYKHLICIAGNHETTFDVNWYNKVGSNSKRYHKLITPTPNAINIKNIILTSKYWVYLEDSLINLYGLNIYGSPWQPYFYNWAFQLGRGNELKEKWKLIPNNCDILITHGPPFCHGDKVSLKRVRNTGDDREYTGDVELLNRVKEINNIKYHIFGHVHAGFGCSKQLNINTTFVNACSVDEIYDPVHKPIVFYIEKKN